MKRLKIFLTTLTFLSLLFAVPPHAIAGDNSFWGTGVGAALGGLAGSQFGRGDGQLAATGLGVFLGGAIGNSIGSSMDRVESMPQGGYGYGRGYGPSYNPSVPYEPNYVAPPAPAFYPPNRRVIYVQPQEVVEYREAMPVYATGGYLGEEEPPPPPQGRHGRYCREFTQKVRVGGRMQESYGTACLQPDGSWQIE